MINETNVKCFLVLAETLNFTKAAKKLYMTQQAVSKNISKLEKEMGFPLFVRTHHFVVLTRAGESFYKLLSGFKTAFDETVRENREYYSKLYRTLRVGYLAWLDLTRYIQKSTDLFSSEVPGVKYYGGSFSKDDLFENLYNKNLDLIVTYGAFAPRISGLKKAVLMKTRNVLIVSTGNPLAADEATYKEFLKEPLIVTSFQNESLSETNKRVDRLIKKYGLSPPEIKIVPNLETAYTETELGHGIMISTELSRILSSSRIKKYPLDSTETLVCLWRQDEENPLVEKFVDCLKRSV